MANSSNAKYSNLALKVETVLNQRYVIRSVIGIGGFGITYQVYDIKGSHGSIWRAYSHPKSRRYHF